MMYVVQMNRGVRRALAKESQNAVRKKIERLLCLLAENPFQTPPRYEKLGEAADLYSRRINVQHRLVYQVDKAAQVVTVIAVRSHYEG